MNFKHDINDPSCSERLDSRRPYAVLISPLTYSNPDTTPNIISPVLNHGCEITLRQVCVGMKAEVLNGRMNAGLDPNLLSTFLIISESGA